MKIKYLNTLYLDLYVVTSNYIVFTFSCKSERYERARESGGCGSAAAAAAMARAASWARLAKKNTVVLIFLNLFNILIFHT